MNVLRHFGAIGLLAPILLAGTSSRGLGWTQLHDGWSSGTFSYKINTTSFASAFGGQGLPLTSSQFEWWITTSASKWVESSGADFKFNHQGTSSVGCGQFYDGENTIAAQLPCLDLGCTILGETRTRMSGGTPISADMCLAAGAAYSWSVELANMVSAMDFASVVTHEFGHVVGLNHTPLTVMDATSAIGESAGRVLTDDDIAGAQALYGTRIGRNRYIRAWDQLSQTWGSADLVTSNDVTRATSTTVGRDSDGTQTLLTTWVRPSGNRVYFSRASVPYLTPSFVQTYIDSTVTTAPAVAARPTGTPLFVAAWPVGNQLLTGCGGLRVYRSADAFATTSGNLTLWPGCTAVQPALTYDSNSNRFLLIFALKDPFNTTNMRLYARTSVNAVSWTDPQDLGVYTTDSPSAACTAAGVCMLSYGRASSVDPWVVNRRFTVSLGGTITLADWSENGARTQVRPSAGTYETPLGYLQAMSYAVSGNNLSNSIGAIWSTHDDTMPFSGNVWTWVEPYTDHSPSVGGSNVSTLYMVYTVVP